MTTPREYCKAEVHHTTGRLGFGRWQQCQRYATKDGYCHQHHPHTIAAKRADEKAAEERRVRKVMRDLDITRLKREILDAADKWADALAHDAERSTPTDDLLSVEERTLYDLVVKLSKLQKGEET